MLNQKDIKNTYWNSNGKYQNFVDLKLNGGGINNLPINKTLKDKYKNMSYAYYRFYNDGDHPRHKAFKTCYTDKEISITLENEINKIIDEILITL